jgi:hypothetical protein
MSIRGKAAAVSYSIVALISLVLGSIYLFSSQFMPYHAAQPLSRVLQMLMAHGYTCSQLCPPSVVRSSFPPSW